MVPARPQWQIMILTKGLTYHLKSKECFLSRSCSLIVASGYVCMVKTWIYIFMSSTFSDMENDAAASCLLSQFYYFIDIVLSSTKIK